MNRSADVSWRPVRHEWVFQYTSHLGYLPPEFRPQFVETVGVEVESDPQRHVQFAADIGMTGVMYPWALSRPPKESATVARALRELGLRGGAVVSVPLAELGKPQWADRSAHGRAELEDRVRAAVGMARELRSGLIVAFPSVDGPVTDEHLSNVALNLRDMSRISGDEGIGIALEPMTLLPHVVVRSIDTAVDLVARAESESVGIIYDTGHVATMGDDLLDALDRVYPYLSLVQFADQPGRVHPGGGTLDITAVAVDLLRRGYRGLVDLEHGWPALDRDAETAGLQQLRAFDDGVRQEFAVTTSRL
ncbi:sugar phosphate isomerase/epimerase family protein [Microbacterium sp. NPDC058062]|uniref:sugar phosphate isomerase/epimerase family protein n=1 Tax=Microbacterium sp. NPDC058062 TaxID=3346320 RepID=UPI0036DE6A5C